MKISIGGGTLALALLLAGCNGDDGNNQAASSASQGPLQQIPAPNNGDWTQIVTQTPEGGYLMGNPDAPVKVVEFASMTCPACARFSREGSEELREQYVRSGQVSFEFRNFVLNAADATASVLARCMPDSAFFRVTEQLFTEQQDWLGNLDEAEGQQIQSLPPGQQLAAYARALELDQFFRARGMTDERFNQCLGDQQAAQRLAERTQQAGTQYRIPGTPSFLINNELADASTWEELEPLIRREIGG